MGRCGRQRSTAVSYTHLQQLGVKVEVLPTAGGDEARALLRSGLHIARRRKSGS